MPHQMRTIDKDTFGPWALVTGASSGIGEQFARHLAASQLNLVLVARPTDVLERLGTELADSHGIQYRVVGRDLSQDGVHDALDRATNDLDIGLVVSNAGAGHPGEFVRIDYQELRRIVQLNVITHLDIAHHFGQKLAARGSGGLLLVSAGAAGGGLPYMANDSASKAYVLNLGEALHTELAPAGVNVTVLVPIVVNTPVVARLGLDSSALPVQAVSTEQCVDDALDALLANQATTISRAQITAAVDGMRTMVVNAIQARMAQGRPGH
jgi:uncharacterized protein